MTSLKGKSVIVTGGSSGIGLAAVELLAKAGCDVTIADVDDPAGQAAAKAAAALGKGRIQFIHTDVGNEDDVRNLVDAAVRAFGKLDGAINAAGVPPANKRLHELSSQEWDRGTGINLRGGFLCIKYQILAMLKNGGGSIVAITSTAGHHQVPSASEYCSAKGGLNSLCRAAALEYGHANIRVNAVMPGSTDTPMFRKANARNPAFQEITSRIPLRRVGEPKEVAAAAVWLISNDASYVTAAVIPVDGAQLLGC